MWGSGRRAEAAADPGPLPEPLPGIFPGAGVGGEGGADHAKAAGKMSLSALFLRFFSPSAIMKKVKNIFTKPIDIVSQLCYSLAIRKNTRPETPAERKETL